MGAGEHDGVGAPPVPLDEARRDLAGDVGVVDRGVVQRGLGEPGEMRRADQGDVAALAEIADQRAGVFALHRRLGAEHRDEPRPRGDAGRLDGRHGADERHGEARAQMRQHQGGGGVAGDHHEIGRVGRDQLLHQRHDARDQCLLAMPAIGKERIVGDIDIGRVGPRLRRPRETP